MAVVLTRAVTGPAGGAGQDRLSLAVMAAAVSLAALALVLALVFRR